MKKNLGNILLSVGFALAAIVYCVVSVANSNSLKAQSKDIAALQNQISAEKSLHSENESEVVYKSTGLSQTRVTRDTETIMNFVKSIFTWDSINEYEAKRSTVIKKYNLNKNSDFVKNFLTAIDDDILRGIYESNNANMKFESMDTYVTAISIKKYSYFNVVTVSSAGENVEVTYDIVIQCDTDNKGNLSNISAFILNDD